jgi:hypothetical protein
MIKSHAVRRAFFSRRTLVAALMLMVPLASLGAASPALAKEPTGAFKRFVQCPRFTPGVAVCIFSEITGGQVTIGSTSVPIEKPSVIKLQGGYTFNEETEAETFVGAINGETLSKTPLKVPGGLLGLIKCNEIKGEGFFEKLLRGSCEAVFENAFTGVNATTELAKPASAIGINSNNLINEEGVALQLPVKVRLENPLLGSECYIGSEAHPVILNLTTGTTKPPLPNKPIKGTVGDLEFGEEGKIIELLGNSLVDNAFAAPEVTGCGGLASFLLDPIIDAKLGLPSAAGKNTAIQSGNTFTALGKTVIKSEK